MLFGKKLSSIELYTSVFGSQNILAELRRLLFGSKNNIVLNYIGCLEVRIFLQNYVDYFGSKNILVEIRRLFGSKNDLV